MELVRPSPPPIWKTIEEFPNYEISMDCVIRNKKTGHIKKLLACLKLAYKQLRYI